jgi:ABC-2 type transport system ATP-binding protein
MVETVFDAVTARGAHKHYGEVRALDGLDLTVRAGEMVAVLGANGAGKTTLIDLLTGLRRPTSGSVSVFGEVPGSHAVRGRIGVMLQDSGVPDGATVREVVALIGRAYPRALPVAEVLRIAGLDDLAGRRCGELSGGQRQRLAFACAIVGDPDLIFLDEPTVALDVDSRRNFWDQVRVLAGLGRTILFSTHYLAEADAVAERIVVLDKGRVIADASPAELKRTVVSRTVRFASTATVDELRLLPTVVSAQLDDEHYVVRATEPEQFLAALFASGRPVRDLTVTEADLESAFLALTHHAEPMRSAT